MACTAKIDLYRTSEGFIAEIDPSFTGNLIMGLLPEGLEPGTDYFFRATNVVSLDFEDTAEFEIMPITNEVVSVDDQTNFNDSDPHIEGYDEGTLDDVVSVSGEQVDLNDETSISSYFVPSFETVSVSDQFDLDDDDEVLVGKRPPLGGKGPQAKPILITPLGVDAEKLEAPRTV